MSGAAKPKRARDAAAPANGPSKEGRAAMKVRAEELHAEASVGRPPGKAEAAVLAKIAEMAAPDRALAERLHRLIATAAPELVPKLWYGQPSYARNGKVVCFFRSGHDDKERYSTFGFTAEAKLDADGGLWPTSYAMTELNEDGAAALAELVKRAVS
ncbi:DUF1801 domain-containing protein [Glycomyces rhizosphaerae]|uniref:DUF1801 domain-containing protein n=1 Tax=Glycomyces rhizosphaerae TaxID=2054422 RepID=A0ABV7Q1W9_9ACTN